MLEGLATARVVGKGIAGYREALALLAEARRVSRLERLAARLERPLLVTKGVNVHYLTGLESSNAAALVEPTGATTLYTDFRYAPAAREVVGVTFVETSRYVIQALAELLTGREIGIEAEHLSYASFETLRSGGVELESTSGVVEALRAVKDADEIAAIRRAAALSDEVFDELSRERFVGRTEAELVWWIDRRLSRARCELAAPSTRWSGSARWGRARTGTPATTSPSPRGRRSWSTPAASSTGTAPTARARS